jgi:hypothetical protein
MMRRSADVLVRSIPPNLDRFKSQIINHQNDAELRIEDIEDC